VLGLFLEVMFIRWLGTEVRIFAYLQNTVLIVCFIGLGLGSLWCRHKIRRWLTAVPVIAFPTLLAVPPTREFLRGLADQVAPVADAVAWGSVPAVSAVALWGETARGLAGMFALMCLISVGFVPIGQVLGRLFDAHARPIAAYSVNVVGSLVGVWGFAALSATYQPPPVWMLVAVGLMVPFLWASTRPAVILGIGLAALVASVLGNREPNAIGVWWSPYQKLSIELVERVPKDPQPVPFVRVNNAGYQAMFDLRPATTRARPDVYRENWHGTSQYDVPYLLHEHPRDVLVVGAGTGNDVAAALRNGAERVVAVEIDPAIVEIGKLFHPEGPYGSPRVRVVVDDARSVFSSDRATYDVISFGLLDAHTMTALSNARLDHYVYTREAFARARARLKPGGLLTVAFAAQHPYIVDRLARTLREEFGRTPDVFAIPNSSFGFGAVMFIARDAGIGLAQGPADIVLKARVEEWRGLERERLPLGGKTVQEWLLYTTAMATDDWPYVYLDRPRVPMLFVVLGVMVCCLPVLLRRVCGASALVPGGWGRTHWHFALLGGAFLLLEVQNISRASVALGSTWLVSAVIITGVLVMVLLANVVCAYWPGFPVGLVAFGLIGSCAALYWIDVASFVHVSPGLRGAVIGLVTCLPMLFGGMLFTRSFARCRRRDEAFGANLVGGMAGGMMQSITFLSGTNALVVIVAVLYLGALLTQPREGAA